MQVALVAAMARNRVIGRDGDLPWHLPADLRRFRALTVGHPVIMGRKTWDSVGGRPLPHRRNIVISRSRPDLPEGVALAPDLDAALAEAARDGTTLAYIAGGGAIYRLALPRADRIELTVIEADLDGDVTFPSFDEDDWRLVARLARPADEKHEYAMRFETWTRS